MKDQPNINALWGALLIEELARQGVRHVVLAPGSRSTPLVVAAARNDRVQCHVCTDERGAAFFALGMARATGVPAAVVTTSGTAAANLLPAVVEASMDRVPLLLLTADRPFELRDCGANQTIRQVDLFGSYPRWQTDLPAPDDRTPARAVLSAAAHAFARARDRSGPVHLNCAFREPLAPSPQEWNRACLEGTEAWCAGEQPFVRSVPSDALPDSPSLDDQTSILRGAATGLVLAATSNAGEHALTVAARLGWPLWADVRSGLRLGAPAPHHLAHTSTACCDTDARASTGRLRAAARQPHLTSKAS